VQTSSEGARFTPKVTSSLRTLPCSATYLPNIHTARFIRTKIKTSHRGRELQGWRRSAGYAFLLFGLRV
jgi:hypothetical protein